MLSYLRLFAFLVAISVCFGPSLGLKRQSADGETFVDEGIDRLPAGSPLWFYHFFSPNTTSIRFVAYALGNIGFNGTVTDCISGNCTVSPVIGSSFTTMWKKSSATSKFVFSRDVALYYCYGTPQNVTQDCKPPPNPPKLLPAPSNSTLPPFSWGLGVLFDRDVGLGSMRVVDPRPSPQTLDPAFFCLRSMRATTLLKDVINVTLCVSDRWEVNMSDPKDRCVLFNTTRLAKSNFVIGAFPAALNPPDADFVRSLSVYGRRPQALLLGVVGSMEAIEVVCGPVGVIHTDEIEIEIDD